MFTSEMTRAENGFEYQLKICFQPWGADTTQVIEKTCRQKKEAYQYFITFAGEFLAWTSDYLYQLIQQIRSNYFDPTRSPYFGGTHKEWHLNYWLFLEARDRARRYPGSISELANSYYRRSFTDLVPIYHFEQRNEIKRCIEIINELSVQIRAAIYKISKETILPIQ